MTAGKSDQRTPVVTLVVLVFAVLAVTGAACVGVIYGQWTPLGVALVASLGIGIVALIVDSLLARRDRS